MFETFVQDWWPQLTALVILIAYLSRTNAATNERLHQLEKKVETLFDLWNSFQNKLVDRGLDKDK